MKWRGEIPPYSLSRYKNAPLGSLNTMQVTNHKPTSNGWTCFRIWTPRIESWAGQCNLSDVSLLAEDTARTGWLEWMGSLQFESRDRMEFCVDKAVKWKWLSLSSLSWTTQILWHIPLSSELPNGLIAPSKPRPRLALLLIALDKLSTAIAALHDRWYGPPVRTSP